MKLLYVTEVTINGAGLEKKLSIIHMEKDKIGFLPYTISAPNGLSFKEMLKWKDKLYTSEKYS